MSICRIATTILWRFFYGKLKLKLKVSDYNIQKEFNMQVNYYKNKDWNVINC